MGRPLNVLAAAITAGLVGAAAPATGQSGLPIQGAAPYEEQMLRLAEVLGALHHLRAICGANDGTLWRDRMQALIESDAPSGERRERLAGAFNASLRTYARTYAVCTPAAQQVIGRFLAEGARISRDVATRYSN